MAQSKQKQFNVTHVKINNKKELELYYKERKLISFAGKQFKSAVLGRECVFALCGFGTISRINYSLQLKTLETKIKNAIKLEWVDSSLHVHKIDGSYDVFVNEKLVNTVLPPSCTPTNTPTSTPTPSCTPVNIKTTIQETRRLTNIKQLKQVTTNEKHTNTERSELPKTPSITPSPSATPSVTPSVTADKQTQNIFTKFKTIFKL